MTDLLFIELGAVVTEIRGTTRCTIEPFCDASAPPTYHADARVEVDFTQSLDEVLRLHGPAAVAERALYDQVVAQMPRRRVQIGMAWPSGGYEGIVSIREDIVLANEKLRAAANALPGPRCKYQVIASIDPAGNVRRYHGFHVQILRYVGTATVFKLVGRDGELTYDPSAAGADAKFYAGGLDAANITSARLAPDTTGAVFINLEELSLAVLDEEVPKLPPSAGL